jgi:hypothetical protein
MEGLDRESVERILDGKRCPKGVRCADSSLEQLCRAKDIGLDRFLECLETEEGCTFSFRMWRSPLLCRCPVRMHLYRRLAR